MSAHTWVKHAVTPIDVILDSDGTPQPFVDPDLDETCNVSNAAYGCMVCGVALTADAYKKPCEHTEDT